MTPLPPAMVFVAGLVILVLGAEMLLRGAARLAALLGIAPILIGLTVVSIGTSMPELAIALTAARDGKGSLAVGNIAGANLVNLLFTLGLSALVRPLALKLQSIRLDVPVMIASALALLALAWDGRLGRGEGLLLLLGGVLYTLALVRLSRRESRAMRRQFAEEYATQALPAPRAVLPPHPAAIGGWNALVLACGLALTLFGADVLVAGAVGIAGAHGVSDAFIGLTIVAIGTSAPELATTLIATLKDERDVAVGNLVGSCIYNVLLILGLTSVVAPHGLAVSGEMLRWDLPFLALVAIACYPVFRSGRRISRAEAACFVAAYLVYLASLLVLRSGLA